MCLWRVQRPQCKSPWDPLFMYDSLSQYECSAHLRGQSPCMLWCEVLVISMILFYAIKRNWRHLYGLSAAMEACRELEQPLSALLLLHQLRGVQSLPKDWTPRVSPLCSSRSRCGPTTATPLRLIVIEGQPQGLIFHDQHHVWQCMNSQAIPDLTQNASNEQQLFLQACWSFDLMKSLTVSCRSVACRSMGRSDLFFFSCRRSTSHKALSQPFCKLPAWLCRLLSCSLWQRPPGSKLTLKTLTSLN